MCHHLDLALALLADLHGVTQISYPAVYLDLVVEEFLKSRDIEDFVGGGLRSVDDKLESACQYTCLILGVIFRFSRSNNARRASEQCRQQQIPHTLLVTFPPFTCLPFGPAVFCNTRGLFSLLF